MKHAIITICLMVMASATCACGAELLVPSQFPTIQLAVNATADGDTVIIADGTYTGPGNTNIAISKTITVRSQNGPENCIIDCNGSYGTSSDNRGFTIRSGILAGLTITKGHNTWTVDGGAVTCYGGNVKLTNCIFINNLGVRAGAVYCKYSNVEITNCSLIGNSTFATGLNPQGFGGAVNCENSSVLIANSTISGNLAIEGGGIYCAPNSSVTIKNCMISNNNATDTSLQSAGGGIFCQKGSLTVIGSQICRNTAASGAGIYSLDAASFLITDCNIKDNVVENAKNTVPNMSGGGIFFKSIAPQLPYGTTAAILNSSITDNIVKGMNCKGGGLYIETPFTTVPSPQNVNVMLSGCVIARNSTPSGTNPGGYGGGLYCKGAIQLTETEILNNSAAQGGGIYNEGPGVTMSRCRISDNSSSNSAAITSQIGEVVIENSVVSGNRMVGCSVASAIECYYSSTLKMINTTVVGNAPTALSLPSQTNPMSSITNSIIYSNCRYPYISCKDQIYPRTIPISFSNIQGGYTGIGNIDTDPCFVQPGHWDTNGTPNPYDDFWVDGDYRLTAVSPCIDTGGVAFLMDNKDLAGNPRITGDGLDMGAYEYQNSTPTAEAGPEQVVYAWIDGNAPVTLDGSASRDADGDELSYLWSWSIDGNNNQANGVSPAIELPVGQHRIELIVNDGLVDSRPDDVNVTVIGPVEGQMWTVPRVINRQGWQPYILVMLKLPEGITMEQIDSNDKLLLYPGGIEPIKQRITQVSNGKHQQIAIMAFFDKASLLAGINGDGTVQLDLVGQFTSGQYFFGQDKIWTINPRQEFRLNLLNQ